MLHPLLTLFFFILTVHTQAQIRYINCVLNNNHKKGTEYSKQYYFDSIGRVEKEVIIKPYKLYKYLSPKSYKTIYSYRYEKDSLLYSIRDYPCIENLEETSSDNMCKDTIYTCFDKPQKPYLYFLQQLQLDIKAPTTANQSLPDTLIYIDTLSICNKRMWVYNNANQLMLDSCISYMQTDCYVGEFKYLRNTYNAQGRIVSSESMYIGSYGYYIELEYDLLTGFISRYRTDKTTDDWWYVFWYDKTNP